MQAYDLIVIGSGPGGQRAAIQAAKSGKQVIVVGGGVVGGEYACTFATLGVRVTIVEKRPRLRSLPTPKRSRR